MPRQARNTHKQTIESQGAVFFWSIIQGDARVDRVLPGAETSLVHDFILKAKILPRQARDKHRNGWKTDGYVGVRRDVPKDVQRHARCCGRRAGQTRRTRSSSLKFLCFPKTDALPRQARDKRLRKEHSKQARCVPPPGRGLPRALSERLCRRECTRVRRANATRHSPISD